MRVAVRAWQVRCVAPPGAGANLSWSIVVAGVRSTLAPNVTSYRAPVVTGVTVSTPSAGPFGHALPTTGGATVLLTGTNLGPSLSTISVLWDGVPLGSATLQVRRVGSSAAADTRWPVFPCVSRCSACGNVPPSSVLQVPHTTLVFVSLEGHGVGPQLEVVVAGVHATIEWGGNPAQGLVFEPPTVSIVDIKPLADDSGAGIDCT